MAQVTGIVKVFVNGTLQRSKPGATLDMGGVEREAVKGHSVYGYKETVMESTCTFTIAHLADVSLEDLAATVDATLRFECDSGVTYLVTNAFVSKTLKISESDGQVEVEMMGDPATEE